MKELKKEDIVGILEARSPDSHKGSYGTVNAVVGSVSYRGAAVLAAMGMLRSGAGIVRVCSVERVCAAVIDRYPSATLSVLKENSLGMISAECCSLLLSICRRPAVTLIGCGLGQSADTAAVVNTLVSGGSGGIVIDADGLNLLALSEGLEQVLSGRCAKDVGQCVITPHLGEMSRLTGRSIGELKADPEGAATEFSRRFGCVTVLKDHNTVIAAPGEDGVKTYISRFGNPGLARGGSGDLLAGLIAGFMAQGYTGEQSALLGVLIHGLSADSCAAERSMQGMLPSDLDGYICRLFRSLGY